MKKTKIICTMGPNTNDRNMMKKLVESGMDIARFNFSHGEHDEQLGRVNILKSVREELNIPVAMLLDTKGPEIRSGVLAGGDIKVELKQGQKFVITMDDIEGDENKITVSYKGLINDVKVGNKILIDDGLIELDIKAIEGNEIITEVVNGGLLGGKKGINVPNVSIKLPALTEKDKKDIVFGIENGFDFIAASFVRTADAVREIKAILDAHNSDIQIIAKIENAEGIDNIEEIIEVADGIMVARGDMGVEIPAEEVPYIQKKIIKLCNENFKPVVTATQMLDSMIRNPRPTRAEVTDVANAIYDGTDAIMLSGESAMGKYPAEAVQMMVKIAETTEPHLEYNLGNKAMHKRNVSSAVSFSSVATAANANAKAIVTPTVSGFTAKLVSKFRPEAQIIAASPSDDVLRKMQVYWGVKPVKSVEADTTEGIAENAITAAKNSGLVAEGDTIVLTCGVPSKRGKDEEKGITNSMRVINL